MFPSSGHIPESNLPARRSSRKIKKVDKDCLVQFKANSNHHTPKRFHGSNQGEIAEVENNCAKLMAIDSSIH
jgi:hypothetical protein